MASETDESGTPERSPSFANAYAVTYRLLGDRELATDLAAEVSARYAAMESFPPRQWLPDVAHDAVEASLGAETAAADLLGGVGDASTREAFRRRLAGADGPTWVAVGLHQLGGYTVAETAELMDYRPETVGRLCGPFDPPPGVTWADLGDPRARAAKPVRRGGGRRRRVPVLPLAAGGIVLLLAIWAATSTGERPTVGDGTDDTTSTTAQASGTAADGTDGGASAVARFGATVDPVPSAGCPTDVAGAEPRTPRGGTIPIEGSAVSYVFIPPEGTGAAPLVVGLPDTGQPPGDFAELTQLHQSLPGALHVTVQPSPGDGVSDAQGVVAVIEEVVSTRCVDLARVTVLGYGTGAVTAGDTACGSPELVSGLAMVAGWRSTDGCELDPAVAVLVSARDDDPALDTGTSLEEIGSAWAALVEGEAEEVEGRDETTLARTWVGPGDVMVTSVSRTEGGHAWTMDETTDVTSFVADTARLLE